MTPQERVRHARDNPPRPEAAAAETLLQEMLAGPKAAGRRVRLHSGKAPRRPSSRRLEQHWYEFLIYPLSAWRLCLGLAIMLTILSAVLLVWLPTRLNATEPADDWGTRAFYLNVWESRCCSPDCRVPSSSESSPPRRAAKSIASSGRATSSRPSRRPAHGGSLPSSPGRRFSPRSAGSTGSAAESRSGTSSSSSRLASSPWRISSWRWRPWRTGVAGATSARWRSPTWRTGCARALAVVAAALGVLALGRLMLAGVADVHRGELQGWLMLTGGWFIGVFAGTFFARLLGVWCYLTRPL